MLPKSYDGMQRAGETFHRDAGRRELGLAQRGGFPWRSAAERRLVLAESSAYFPRRSRTSESLKRAKKKILTSKRTIGPYAEQVLTYGIFTDSLQGLNNFRLFYPHLNFGYEIYVYPGEGQAETYVGRGVVIGPYA